MSGTTPSSDPNDPTASGPLRRLLPASPQSESASMAMSTSLSPRASMAATTERRSPSPIPNSPATSSSNANPPLRKKRQATTAACGACRRRKSRCNGERPKCSVCVDRGTECQYATNAAETHTQALKRKFGELQSQKTIYEQVFEVLQTRSEHEANEVFKRIRGGSDINTILRYINFGDVLVQLAVVPEARYRYEFPYIAEMPAPLLRPDNPYLDSKIYECSLRSDGQVSRTQPHYPRPDPMFTMGTSPQLDPYLKPFHAASIMDPLLDAVRPSMWTSISTDDVLMRKLLHEYFMQEYNWFTFFQKDLFLKDMHDEKPRFCNKLLANAVLCAGCYCYRALQHRAEYWNPKNIGYQFLAEARRLFEYESDLEKPEGSPNDPSWASKYRQFVLRKLVTIQASLVLSLIYAYNGSDKIGWRYTLRAVEMAYEIQLFDPLPDADAEEQCAWGFTAWALFNFQSLTCYHYFRTPLRRTPPDIPLPDAFENPQWYGEFWVRYPLSQARLPVYQPLLFKAKSELWVIINDYQRLLFGRADPHKPLLASQVIVFYERLVGWLHDLPEPLTPRKIVYPHQITLHMEYNLILIGILKPVRNQDWGVDNRPFSLETPREAYFNAMVRFETAIRLYYLRHGYSGFDSFLTNFFGHLGQMAMDAFDGTQGTVDPTHQKSTLLLAAIGLHDQSSNHYMAKAVFRMLLSSMPDEDVQTLKRFAKIEAEENLSGPLEQPVQSDWPEYARTYTEDYGSISRKLESLSLEPPRASSAPPDYSSMNTGHTI